MPITSILDDALNTNKPNFRAWLAAQEVISFTDPDYGAVGDGVANNTSALNLAGAQTGNLLWVQAGNYKFSSEPDEPELAGIIGEGSGSTTFTAAAGVTELLSVGTTWGTHLKLLDGFRIVGNADTNGRGIVLGNGQLSSDYSLRDIRISGYTGTGAIGAHFADCVGVDAYNCYFDGNTLDAYFAQINESGAPTTCFFSSCKFRTATTNGVKLVGGDQMRFMGCTFEANTQEGVNITAGASTNVTDALFEHCRWESNYSADATKFQLSCTATAGGTARPIVHGGKFVGTAKSIRMTGSGCAGFIIKDPQCGNGAATITIDNGAYGRLEMPENLIGSYLTIVSDSNVPPCQWGAYASFTPTYSSNVGNAAATYTSGTVTTTNMRITRTGAKTVKIVGVFTATLNAVTPAYLQMSLPAGIVPQSNNAYGTATVKNGSTYETGIIGTNVGSALFFYRANFANFGSGAAVEVLFTFEFEIL